MGLLNYSRNPTSITTSSIPSHLKENVRLCAGGGNLDGLYRHCREFFQTFHKSAQRLVLLPHTVAKNKDLLSELGSNVTIFARERLRYEHLKKFAKKAGIFLDNDLPFNLTANDFLKMKPPSFLEASVAKCFHKLASNKQEADKIPSPNLMLKNSVFEYKTQLSPDRNAASFRDDDEKLVSIDARDNADLSSIYNYDTRNPQLCTYAAQRLFKHITGSTPLEPIGSMCASQQPC